MAEILDKENQAAEAPAAGTSAAEAPASGFSEAAPVLRKKKNRKKTVRRIVTLVIVAALLAGAFFAWRRFKGGDGDAQSEVLTETVGRGSITSMVEGSGAAVAKNSASITLLSDGQVLDVYVSEGDFVYAGDLLYSIEAGDAQSSVDKAAKRVRAAQKELDRLADAANDLNVRADFAGILLDVADIKAGDEVSKGDKVATLADNTRLLLPLYFSYAYEHDIYVGQSATVSVPITMAQLPGTVYEIHKVQRVSAEGGKLFEVVIVLDNPGTLTGEKGEDGKKMVATATLSAGGETIYPYEYGELEWFRTASLTVEINGECAWNNLYNYMPVKAGESVMSLTAESSEDALADQEAELQAAMDSLEKAQKNLDALNGIAPIDGTVLTIGITAGEEAKTGTVAVSIADTTTMIVNATVDEMNVSYAKPGMMVNIDLWDQQLFGVIDSVSLTATAENGVARFPMVISVDNSEGLLMSGAYVQYSFTASQSDDCLIVPIQCVKSAQTMDGESCKVLFVQTDVPPENEAELAMDMMDVPEGFYPVIVETGISDNYNVEILSGVEEFTTVYAGVMNNGGMGFGMYF
ncbi:MAG: HlyD family efflux transporter periplasmic adaptor subunit [Oscillospiraceae bacterium]|nr:HlyD family efflux transporter periplasmic adaptor subunit [Oscillospiraceae bacterium]